MLKKLNYHSEENSTGTVTDLISPYKGDYLWGLGKNMINKNAFQ